MGSKQKTGVKCGVRFTAPAVLVKRQKRITVTMTCGQHARRDGMTCRSHFAAHDEKAKEALNSFFVYGTLKHGYGNHRVMGPGVVKIEPATVEGFTLYGDGIPYARRAPGSHVCGELITISPETLAASLQGLDRLEGHPTHYVRTLVRVRLRSGEERVAWMYVQAHEWSHARHLGSTWPRPRAPREEERDAMSHAYCDAIDDALAAAEELEPTTEDNYGTRDYVNPVDS